MQDFSITDFLLSQSCYNNSVLFLYNISHNEFDIKIDQYKQKSK